MKADDVTEKEVMDVLSKFADCYSKRDIEGLMSLIASDPDVVLFSLDAEGKHIGLDEIKTQFESEWSQFEAASIEFNWTSISAAGTVAWVSANYLYKMTIKGHNIIFTCSVTIILEKRGDRWIMVHGHYSVPVVEQPHSDVEQCLSQL
jgi:ketosteroid isomerase-like protein